MYEPYTRGIQCCQQAAETSEPSVTSRSTTRIGDAHFTSSWTSTRAKDVIHQPTWSPARPFLPGKHVRCRSGTRQVRQTQGLESGNSSGKQPAMVIKELELLRTKCFAPNDAQPNTPQCQPGDRELFCRNLLRGELARTSAPLRVASAQYGAKTFFAKAIPNATIAMRASSFELAMRDCNSHRGAELSKTAAARYCRNGNVLLAR